MFNLSYIILYYTLYAVVCWYQKSGVRKINLIQPSGLVEAALVCLNLWFCLLLNIFLHCHNNNKSDKNKWQLLVEWISIEQKSSNWTFPPPQPPPPPHPPPFMARHCIYVDREGTELLIYCIYSLFSQYWNLILVASQKNSVLTFVVVLLYLLFEYYRGFFH